jgi:multiple antibiotic resistance protein
MNDAVNAFLLIYAGLFPIVNPVGSAPLFLGLTHHCGTAERRTLARRVAWNGFFLLLGSMLAGSYVLEFFGITLPAVRIAGGMVVTAFGWKMLHSAREPDDKAAASATIPGAPVDAFYPLTMPLTVGPGSISVAITLGSQRPPLEAVGHFALVSASAIAGLVAMAITIYVCYRSAARIVAVLGKHGSDVLMRLSAFILLCIGVQIVWNGCAALIATLAMNLASMS